MFLAMSLKRMIKEKTSKKGSSISFNPEKIYKVLYDAKPVW